jgi:hypothetical protein
MGSPWQYTPLQAEEIRLLVLDPGRGPDDLSGSILVTRYDPENNHVPRYEALSYTWGDQTNPDYISLRQSTTKSGMCELSDQDAGEHGGPTRFAIGRNLATCLRQLRLDNDTRVLWCDSICINQQDLDERAAQVRRMGGIYKYAALGIAWLGPADDQS